MEQLDQVFSVRPAPYPVIIKCIGEAREPSIACGQAHPPGGVSRGQKN